MDAHPPVFRRGRASRRSSAPRPPWTEAVAQTPGELAGSFLRVGSQRGHLLRRTQRVSRPVVPHDSPGVYFRERGAAFPRWLCATASVLSASEVALGTDTFFRAGGRRVSAGMGRYGRDVSQ